MPVRSRRLPRLVAVLENADALVLEDDLVLIRVGARRICHSRLPSSSLSSSATAVVGSDRRVSDGDRTHRRRLRERSGTSPAIAAGCVRTLLRTAIRIAAIDDEDLQPLWRRLGRDEGPRGLAY